MELFRIEDVSEFAEFSDNIPEVKFNRVQKLITANSITPYISKPCLTAIQALDREDPTDQAKELYSFWFDYVRPYAVFAAYELFTDMHGMNFAPNGILNMAGGGPQSMSAVSSAERSSLRKMAVKYRDVYLAKMVEEYTISGATFDGVSYDATAGAKPKVSGIRAIGSVTAGMATKRRFRL